MGFRDYPIRASFPLMLSHMRTIRTQGTWCILPDGPASYYRTLGTHLGSSSWEPPRVSHRLPITNASEEPTRAEGVHLR